MPYHTTCVMYVINHKRLFHSDSRLWNPASPSRKCGTVHNVTENGGGLKDHFWKIMFVYNVATCCMWSALDSVYVATNHTKLNRVMDNFRYDTVAVCRETSACRVFVVHLERFVIYLNANNIVWANKKPPYSTFFPSWLIEKQYYPSNWASTWADVEWRWATTKECHRPHWRSMCKDCPVWQATRLWFQTRLESFRKIIAIYWYYNSRTLWI